MSWKGESHRHAMSARGIKTSFDTKKQIVGISFDKRMLYSHSYRNYRPEEFLEYSIESGKINEEKYRKAREILYEMESRRFQSMLYDASKFFANLDEDEQITWAKNNPELMKWIGVYGFLFQYNTHEKYTGVPSFFDFKFDFEAGGIKKLVRKVDPKTLNIQIETTRMASLETIEEYKNKIRRGEEVTPIFVDKNRPWHIVDGNHRAQAYRELNMKVPIIKVDRDKTLRKMIWMCSPSDIYEDLLKSETSKLVGGTKK